MNYDFKLNLSSHPFAIRLNSGDTISEVPGTYNNDATNGKIDGVIMFTPNSSTPNTIVYQCSVHPTMIGTITILNQ